LTGDRSQDQRPADALRAADFRSPQDWDRQGHGRGFVALADDVKHPVSAHGVGIVLDPHRRGLGGAQGVNPEEKRQGAVVDGNGLSDLQEPDQLKPVQALGAGLVPVDLGKPGVHGGVAGDEAVDMGEPEEPADRMHACDHRGVHQAALAKLADVQLDMSALDPHQRVESVALAPGQPLPELKRVQDMGTARVPGQIRDRGKLRGRHRRGLKWQNGGRNWH
jgi:hypothetical protein